MFLSFCYVFFPVFNVFFGFSSVFRVFLYFPFILLGFLLSFQRFLRFSFVFLAFFVFPFHFATFSSQFQCFLRFCCLFLSIHYTFCYIPSSCFADFTCFFNLRLFLYFAIMSCNFEIFSFQLAICWSHFAIFRAGFIQV